MLDIVTTEVRLLGPVDVRADGATRHLSGLRRKAVLAVLGLHPGLVVSTDRIVDIVWGERPPATVANALQNTVAHLRRLLGGKSRIVASPPGYSLLLPAGAIDLDRAESLILRRGPDIDPAQQVARMRIALDLWRGVSLSDVAEVPWLAEQSHRLEGLRAEASASLVDARMALGEHAQLVPELEQLTEAYPFQEDLHRQLILALYRSGRQEAALAAYQRLRRVMVDELGIGPGPALRELEVAILRQDPGLDLTAPIRVSAPSSAPVSNTTTPAQLPHHLRTFSGRVAQLAELDAALAATDEMNTPVVAISGTAGVGKTTLAVRWANSVAAAFPDGQLYVNLRGFDPAEQAVPPTEVLHGFLRALSVSAEDIPATLDEQAALYRTVLAGRRILLVLDNARDEGQVRPLLPGPSGGLVLITSRNRLTGLIVAEGVRTVRLDLPSVAEARQILTQRLGAQRVAAEPAAVDDIIASCARLPLALAVAAAHPAADPHLTLADLADQLRDSTSPLDPFHGGDTATDIRAVFSWSYQTLSVPAARLFRQFGVCRTPPDFSLAAAASLAGLTPRQTRPLLAELTRMHLLTETFPDRFGCHDLVRAFANEQASEVDAAADRSATMHRLLDHCLHTAFTAARLLRPGRNPIVLTPARPGACVADLADADAATVWFEHELSPLLAAVRMVPPSPTWRPWQLAWTLVTFLDRQARWDDYAAIQHAALDEAERSGDTLGQAYAHFYLARVNRKLNRLADTREHHERAIHLFGVVDDPVGQARVLNEAAHAADVEGRTEDGIRYCERALVLHRAAGFRSGEAHALSNLGWLHLKLGNIEAALDLTRQGLALHLELDDRKAQADSWDSLGRLHFRLGDSQLGTDCYNQAISIYEQLGDWYNAADTLAAHGGDLASAGGLNAAHHAWQRAAALLDRLNQADAEQVRRRLPVVSS